MARKLVPVNPSRLSLGDPLPFTVYDRNGLPLMKMGVVVEDAGLFERLIEVGHGYEYSDEDALAASLPQNPFDATEMCKLELKLLFSRYKQRTLREADFHALLRKILALVEYASEVDAEAALASLHLDVVTEYTILHHVQAALLCELIARHDDMEETARRSLVSAALTHDIGIADIQDALERHDIPLHEGLRQRIQTHPVDGVRVLRSFGVEDGEWLAAVAGHHERTDGSGYPSMAGGGEQTVGARILAIADTYSAMVRDRPYRKARLSQNALRHLFLEQSGKLDPRYTQMLIKTVGVFPPGSLVRLHSGEVAVVKSCRGDASNPLVYAFTNTDGLPMQRPRLRDTREDRNRIVALVSISTYKNWIALVRQQWMAAGA